MDDATRLDPILGANRKAKGKRPAYFDDPALDRMLSILMAVAGELAVVRERLDTVERLLEAKGTLARADIERYAPDRAAGEERGLMMRAYVARILRGVQQDMEALEELEPPIEEVVADLARS
ncbi:MAG: hypothetical protein NZM40_02705 [Sphingomonadaceae bacterium]|uniref:hypothetical protein n=1 Tax=Thermaurantiacus sp. TaxID=2820283 RepID=UPI00298F39CF|nr:hypothetical protein [Thermaurantiacus sp.]MCS6986335.1 hypothetical protein [Sphingomonadaceae bacterium]MDW8414403.1 hypothetical protein [Thermaurantiacus sp.]